MATVPSEPEVSLVFNKQRARWAANIWWSATKTRRRVSLEVADRKQAVLAFGEFKRLTLPVILREYAERNIRVGNRENPTCDEMIAAWKRWASEHLRPTTIATTTISWDHLTRITKRKLVREVTREEIEYFKRERREEVKLQTVNNNLKDLRAIFNRCARENIYTGPNPVATVERFRVPRSKVEFHTQSQRAALLRCARKIGQRTEWLVLLLGWLGLRRREAINCRWEWFTWDNGRKPTLHIRSFPGFTIKDFEDRSVPIPKSVYKVLYPHRMKSGFMFHSQARNKGKGVWRYRYEPRRALLQALKKAKLPKEEPFQRLRVTFGSILIQKGVPIEWVSVWMGHEDIATTRRHYMALLAYHSQINAQDRRR